MSDRTMSSVWVLETNSWAWHVLRGILVLNSRRLHLVAAADVSQGLGKSQGRSGSLEFPIPA